jgi:DNA helicase II / ATP-dependent DNA helicase PcrA
VLSHPEPSYFKMSNPQLNEPQTWAVQHASGPLLVFAGAGSGKTRTITFRIAHLLAGENVPPYRILAVTFTNKAAGEMRDRIEQLVGHALARDLWVGTFHSVAARLLRRYCDEVGLQQNFVIYDESDQKALMTRLLKKMNLSDREFPPRLILSRIHRRKQEGLTPDQAKASANFDATHVTLYAQYQQALLSCNAVDFEDLILLMMRLSESRTSPAGEELRSRFDHVLVDEFQDTNSTQYRLVRALSAKSRNLCVVGDDDQSIYRWRGANVGIIRGFKKDFPDAFVVKLEQNYRSTANIVKAALSIIESATTREPKQLWTEQAPGSRIALRAVSDERDEAACVVKTVQKRLSERVDPRQIAVFYRVHAQSRVLEEAFRAENLPYQIVGGTRFFDRAEVKDIVAYLRLVDNPTSEADLIRIINVPARGIGKKTVEQVFEEAARLGTSAWHALTSSATDANAAVPARHKLRQFVDLINEWRAALSAGMGPFQLANRIVDESGYRKYLKEQDNAESDARIGNIEEFLGSIAEYEDDAALTDTSPTLTGYLERISLVSAPDTMKDVPKVALMTVHAAKGLEFDTVLLTGMENDVFPYRGLDSAELEELDEERRLAYVAVTRAKNQLYIYHASQRTLFGQTRYLSRSLFLDELPEDTVVHESSYASPSRGTSDRFTEVEPVRPLPTDRWLTHRPSTGAQALRPGERIVDRSAFDDIADAGPLTALRRGQTVFHQRFGRGVVEKIESGSDSATVTAMFPGFGRRKILSRYLVTG